jgi:hypothetical protein
MRAKAALCGRKGRPDGQVHPVPLARTVADADADGAGFTNFAAPFEQAAILVSRKLGENLTGAGCDAHRHSLSSNLS